MNNYLIPLIEKILLRKPAIIESVNDQLKNICQIQQTRSRSVSKFMVNLLGGLIAYTYHPIKPSFDLKDKGLPALPSAIFKVRRTHVYKAILPDKLANEFSKTQMLLEKLALKIRQEIPKTDISRVIDGVENLYQFSTRTKYFVQ